MGFGLGDIVGKVVEYSTPPGLRLVADAIKPGSGDKIAKASGDAAKKLVDSPLTPYGAVKTATETIAKHPKEAANVADKAARVLNPVYGIARAAQEHPEAAGKVADVAARAAVPAYGLARAAAEHPDQAKSVAKVLSWIAVPGLMAAKEGAEAIAKHPAEAKQGLAVSDAITKYLPGGSLMQDIRKGIFGF